MNIVEYNLIETIKHNSYAALRFCQEENEFDPNFKTKKGRPLIYYAIFYNHFNIAVELIQKGTDPNITVDKAGKKVLWLASYKMPALIPYLLEAGADPNIKDNNGDTIFHNMERFSISLIDKILEYCPDVNIKNDHGRTPLFSIIMKYEGAPDIWLIDYLITLKGADIYETTDDGMTIIDLAIQNSYDTILLYLYKLGVDINIQEIRNNSTDWRQKQISDYFEILGKQRSKNIKRAL